MQLPFQKVEVDSYVRYCTDRSLEKNSDDWAALKVRCVVKGEPYKFNLNMPVRGCARALPLMHAHVAEEELMEQCAKHILERAPTGGIIVPVPNSNALVGTTTFKTMQHATRIAQIAGCLFSVAPAIRWRTQQEKSHLGGRSRSYKEHLRNMLLDRKCSGDVILYDDVVTTGSQLAASHLLLTEAGANVLGKVAVVSVLDHDGVTHSDLWCWKTEKRLCA